MSKKTVKRYGGQIPYYKDGGIADYVGWDNPEFRHVWDNKTQQRVLDENGKPVVEQNIFWRDNEPFDAVLTLQSFERGRSAAHALFKNQETGARFTMFLTDLEDVAKAGAFEPGGIVRGTFDGVKRGQNYGVRLLPPGWAGESAGENNDG